MSTERIPVSEVPQAPSQPWNRDGYLPNVPSGTQILKVGLGTVRVQHPYEDHLFRVTPRKDALVVQRLRGFPPAVMARDLTVQVDELRWPSVEPVTVTDVFFSPETNRLYVLDGEAASIHLFRLPPVEGGSGLLERERAIRLALPRKVDLTRDSQIVVVSRVSKEPEKRDSFFYLSAPGSHVILKVDAETGAASVALGSPGRPGTTRTGEGESSIFLREPSALFFDELGGRLYWADSGQGAIFATGDGAITQIASLQGNVKLTSLLVYRLKDHVDEAMMLQKDDPAIAPDWEEADPALLLVTDAISCEVFKIRLHSRDRSPKVIFDLATQSPADPTTLDRLMALPNGDLLLSTDSAWAYHVRHSLGSPSSVSQDYIS